MGLNGLGESLVNPKYAHLEWWFNGVWKMWGWFTLIHPHCEGKDAA